MISRLTGVLDELEDNAALIECGGIGYEVLVPACSVGELALSLGQELTLHTLYYIQMDNNKGVPLLLGFLSKSDRDFFEQFTTVAGIGPRLASKALARPIEEIASAINAGDLATLIKLPSIGSQKAKQISAKLQGKVTRFALSEPHQAPIATGKAAEAIEEARLVLAQLRLTRTESDNLLVQALELLGEQASTEALVNEAMKRRGAQL